MRISDWSSDVCSSDLINYAYLDSKFTEFPGVIVRPSTGEVVERIDTPVTGAPKHKLDVAARYVIEAGPDIGDFVLAGNGSYQRQINISDDALFSATSREHIARASGSGRLCTYVLLSVVAYSLIKKYVHLALTIQQP